MRLTALADKRGIPGRLGGLRVSQGASIPPPIEGWDAVSPISAMSPKRAIRLINWFPQPGWVELRRGFRSHVNTGVSSPVETLAAYQGVTTQKLFAVAGGNIYDTTSDPAVLAVSGLASSRFQFVQFATTGGNFLYMVNGANDPQYFDGSAWHVAAITGVAGSDLIHVNAHKNRLWFVQDDTSDAWYLATGAIAGAATKFPLGGLFTAGGALMAMGTWSVDAGDGPDDYAVFISTRGQVAIYRGTDPASASTWALVGVFNMGAPIGRRCLTRVGSDIAIICIDGVVPLSKAMIFERAAVVKVTLTQNIQHAMNDAARNYAGNFGWQLISYPKGTRAILNVPISENSEQQQYTMNTINGAWCQFTGMNGSCWELFEDRIFFGGNEGTVFEADVGGIDNTAVLTADMMLAFNYFGVRGQQKRWTMVRPLLTTDGAVNPSIGLNVDFQTDATLGTSVTTSSSSALWDVATWDVSFWAGDATTVTNWTSVTGLGYCASIRMKIDVYPPASAVWGSGTWGFSLWGDVQVSDITLQVNGFDTTFETGAFV